MLAHIERRPRLIDSRPPNYHRAGTIPSAVSIPHTDTAARLSQFRARVATVLFCNGPQCAATPDAIEQLLSAASHANASSTPAAACTTG